MNANSIIRCEEHRRDGELHRDPAAGPALIKREASGALTREENWVLTRGSRFLHPGVP